MDWDRISDMLWRAQLRLRAAMLNGSADLSAGIAAWDRAVRLHNEWTAAASHALHAERRASEALDALAAWVGELSHSTVANDGSVVPPIPATPAAEDAA